MLDLVRDYYTTSMALYPDEKRTWKELHHTLLLQQMLEHFLKGWPVLFVFHLDSKVAHSDTVWILHLLQITEHSFTHRQGFINVNGAQVYKLRLVYCPNINRLHRFPLLGCDISWIIRDFRCDIKYARDLRALSPPVGIYFETENINTLSQNGELLLTVLAAFAQDESVNKSISVAWGIRQRFAKGIPKLVKPYGYQNVDGKLVVDEEEAGVVIRIFAFYLGGKTPYEIAKILTHEGIPTPTGKKPCWTISSVTYILGNDRYCGDVIMQKSLCVDLFAHKRVRNLGQVERYRMRDVHPPLISKEEWREAKNRISMPDREAVILEEITGEGILSSLHPILFKEDIDV